MKQREGGCQIDKGCAITSGGGFSTYFEQPDYQKDAVDQYFSTLPKKHEPVAGYNRQGRAYPDVALLADNYPIIAGGYPTLVSGTSASAPVFAGMISLINSARLNASKSALGFINPALYMLANKFAIDIMSGDNRCTMGVCCSEGFYTSPGWDPMTGIGSVDFSKMLNEFVALGDDPFIPSLSPGPAPTMIPTPKVTSAAVPTYNSGFLYGIYSKVANEPCTGTAQYVEAFATNVCNYATGIQLKNGMFRIGTKSFLTLCNGKHQCN